MLSSRRRLAFELLESRRVLSLATAATVFVNIPDNLTAEPGAQVVAPVNIDNAAGVRGAEIRINYDTARLDAAQASVTAGSVWPDGAQVVANVDDAAGTIVVFVSTESDLPAVGGSLLNVAFAVRSDAPVGGSTAVDLARVRLNEGAIVPAPEPVPGPDPTDGRITFVSSGATAGVSGVVYADTNVNHQPDPFEGVPRIKILLLDAGGVQQRETYTDDSGRYEFNNLDAGSYRIHEVQSAALLEGGVNEISVTLADGQTLADQNFRERGLAPQYVYNRLFTSSALPVGSAAWISAIRRIIEDAGMSSAQPQTASTVPAATSAAPTSAITASAAAEGNLAASQAVEANVAAEPIARESLTLPATLSTAAPVEAAPDNLQAAATVYVHVPDSLTAEPGAQVVAPVNIDNAAGVRGAEIGINYDTARLDAAQASVSAGSVWPDGAQVVANVDDAAGAIVVFVSTESDLPAVGGSLLNVAFAVRSDAPVGGSTAVDLARVRLNEGAIVPAPEPVPGPDPTDGRITFVSSGATAGVSGVVYADTNVNHQADPFEGVPRIKILLLDAGGVQQRETYTDDSGRYEFNNLDAGSYRIHEVQSAALLEGGVNEISVTLADGQTLADQNFRERGLAPQYVYNRLFTSSALPVGSAAWISAIRRIVTDAENAAEETSSARLASVDLALSTSDSWL